jgi:hypothetical protein
MDLGKALILLVMVEVVVLEGVSGGEGDFKISNSLAGLDSKGRTYMRKDISHTFFFLTL